MECSLPMDGRRVSLTQLSKDSFRECQATLTLTDLLIIIFSGISVSVVAIMTSFFLASTVHCFQRWSKGTKGDEEESEEWEGCHLNGPAWSWYLKQWEDTADSVCYMWQVSCCLLPGEYPGLFNGRISPWYGFSCFLCTWNMVTKDIPREWAKVPIRISECPAPLAKWYYRNVIFGCESLWSSFMATGSWLSVVGLHNYSKANTSIMKELKIQK